MTNPDPFSNAFADMFSSKFEDLFKGGGLFPVRPIEVKKCETKAELAAWFTNFARNCRAILPVESKP